MPNKRELTETLVALLPDSVPISLDRALKTWYMNLRARGGLRLTDCGYLAYQMLEIESWTVGLDVKHLNKPCLLALDRKLTFPYYIDTRKKQLVMFSSKEAMLATLYVDLKHFLDNYG
jgi:hypothetical protein